MGRIFCSDKLSALSLIEFRFLLIYALILIWWWVGLLEGIRRPCWFETYASWCVQTRQWKAWRNELKKRKIRCCLRWLIPGLKTRQHSRIGTLFSFDSFVVLCPIVWFYKTDIGKSNKIFSLWRASRNSEILRQGINSDSLALEINLRNRSWFADLALMANRFRL